jgi:endonuclease/exonuclease/phosphatase family metal-dependent hydrolase
MFGFDLKKRIRAIFIQMMTKKITMNMKQILLLAGTIALSSMTLTMAPTAVGAAAEEEETSDSKTAATLRVMTYNIHHARGMDDHVDPIRVGAVLENYKADVVGLQEVDRFVERSQRRDLTDEIAKASGLSYAVFGKNIDHQGGDYGNAILSRYPILESYNHHLTMLRPGEQRGILWAKIKTPSGPIWFASTHIDYRRENEERISNVKEFLAMSEVKKKAEPGTPLIIVGDFNDFPDTEVHKLMKSGFRDSWEMVGKGKGFTYSSVEPRSRIDYIYLRQGDALQPKSMSIPATEASDHSPLGAVLEFSASAQQ